MKTMGSVLGNVLCKASHCIPVKDRYRRQKIGGRKLYRKYTRREGDLVWKVDRRCTGFIEPQELAIDPAFFLKRGFRCIRS